MSDTPSDINMPDAPRTLRECGAVNGNPNPNSRLTCHQRSLRTLHVSRARWRKRSEPHGEQVTTRHGSFQQQVTDGYRRYPDQSHFALPISPLGGLAYSSCRVHRLHTTAASPAPTSNGPSNLGTPPSVQTPPTPLPTRRKSILLNVQSYEPNMPAPGEVATSPATSRRPSFGISSLGGPAGSPKRLSTGHGRQSSLGEMHQELEVEQEAQVNRLLGMIRAQQAELQSRKSPSSSNAIDDTLPATNNITTNHPPSRPPSFSRRSRTSSIDPEAGPSNIPRRTSIITSASRIRGDSFSGDSDVGRDENAYYQAEAQIMTRENQMLRHRIKELEKQVAELNRNSPTSAHDPVRPSALAECRMAEDEK